jgi:hypothetical protein
MENVTYRLIGSNGKSKTLFQPNKLGKMFFKAFRFLPKIPLLFGFNSYSLLVSNLVTNAGVAGVASRVNGNGAEAAFTYIAIGTGTAAAAATDTTLGTEITTNGGERGSATATRTTTDVSNDTATLVKTFTFTGSFAVTESGVLNAASAGTMLARQVFSAINVVSGDSLQITWNFDID